MKRFRKILVFLGELDRAKTAVQFAMDLSERNQAELNVYSVIEDYSIPWLGSGSIEGLIEDKGAQIRDFIMSIAGDRFKGKIEVLTGTPFLEIVRKVQQQRYDLVIKPACGVDGPVRSMLFGSTAMHLIRKCPCPVWVVKDQKETGLSKVLIALSASRNHGQNDELDKQLLQLGTSLAERYQAKWEIAHAWRLFGESLLKSGRGNIKAEELEMHLNKEKLASWDRVQKLIESCDFTSAPAEIHIKKGYPSDVIPAVAESTNADVVVMGSLGRTGIAGLFMSNTAEEILNQINCSVMTIKPSGFISPVKE